MSFRTCDHLKADGVYCSSPALTNHRFCYFHLNIRARRVQAAQAKLRNEPFRLHLPILDNAHAVLTAIQQVLDALADNRLSARQAAVHLYGIQMASAALKSRPEWKAQRPEVAADEPLCALEIHTLRDQYDLPYDVELDVPPDAAAAQIEATIGLTPDARPCQTRQLSLARVPARTTEGAPGSPGFRANPGEVPDTAATVRKHPAETSPAAAHSASDAA